jgi:DNA polymerase-3 subunit gamma/tau
MDRVLALSLRPKLFEDLMGQEQVVSLLSSQFSTGRVPHFYIIHGSIGTGKTTLARILALALQHYKVRDDPMHISNDDWDMYKTYDISEVNASNKNGIDDVRAIVELMRYMPLPPSKAKVIILDEAHQLTVPAQNALITETEDVANHVYYIFCTSQVNKIIPALQRRAYMLSPKPVGVDCMSDLLVKAKTKVGFEGDTTALEEALIMNHISSPGLILQAAEKFFAGVSAMEAVFHNEATSVDVMAICKAVSVGRWKDVAKLLKDVNKGDASMLRSCLLGYLKTILLKSIGSKAMALSKAIHIIATCPMEDNVMVPGLMASICLACEPLRAALNQPE